jgi:hypothetical protein
MMRISLSESAGGAALEPGAGGGGGGGNAVPGGERGDSLQLERVVGLSAPGPGTLSFCPARGAGHRAAYAAGASAVVYDTAARRAAAFLRSRTSNRQLRTVAWSPDGARLAAGEAGGHGGGGAIHVWDVESGACVQELKGQHRHGVASLSFSPDGAPGGWRVGDGGVCGSTGCGSSGSRRHARAEPAPGAAASSPPPPRPAGKLLASTGAGHDGQVCVWDWRAGALLARQSLQGDVAAAAFTEDGLNLIAAGKGTYKVREAAAAPAELQRSAGGQRMATEAVGRGPRRQTLPLAGISAC